MRPLAAFIDSDTESEVVSAFCFLARRGLLEQVGMFEPAYRNSCEDIDLCLKIRKAGFRIMVSRRARVLHHGEASRYLPGTSTDLDLSHDILRRRWFADRHLGEKHE
jgi:GT2 family glycosyltransferase